MSRAILHVDMDAFFASVEVRERPELRGRPVIVGGTPEGRGVVAAASYEARRFGVHSAMPTATALRLCPKAVVLPPRHGLYSQVSRRIHTVFERYTPQIEPLSLDEAFLDVTGSLRLFGSAAAIGRRIKGEILEELGLIASVGVAPNKFLAKLASDMNKPDGFFQFDPERIAETLDPLPVTRLWGVGPATARQLERLGIRTVGQLRHYSRRLIVRHLGRGGEHLWELAHGIDARPVVSEQETKSVSNETTFARDIHDPNSLRMWLSELSEQVAWRLRRQELAGRTITLKVRFQDFTTVTRSLSLPAVTDLTSEIRDTALRLYEERLDHPHPSVRLLGVGVSGFETPEARQQSLFHEVRARNSRVDTIVDQVRSRFGRDAVRRGGSRR
ncbi:DNA polymerase IV [Thiohalomonas denitrificans]|uniref:DNA polymerase IV n=1 Tax=Thiohalomonas denitrificans TaxID=415747 RepID=A0A1G5PYG4_9GAMM|nr:DNA polymerase IV [Thiohalomonas denitrificans]SCZ54614.1 DNA polymerase-4 [Thiohalomonas denitrificans]